MAEQDSSSLTVTDPVQARLMIHPHFGPLMDALTGREASVGALAKALGWPLDTTHYRVGKLCRAGLLKIVREEKRAGRAIKMYRAVADAFFLPYAAFTAATLEEKFLRHELNIARALVKSQVRLLREVYPHTSRLGPYLYRTQEGQLREDLATGPAQPIDLNTAFPTATEHLRGLLLNEAQARELKAELDALAHKYGGREAGQPLTHVMRLWLFPARAEDWSESR